MKKTCVLAMALFMVLILTGAGYSYSSCTQQWPDETKLNYLPLMQHRSGMEPFDRSHPSYHGWGKSKFDHSPHTHLASEKMTFNTWMAPAWEKGDSKSTFTLSLNDFFPDRQGTLTSASLKLSFEDDCGWFDLPEFAKISYGYGRECFEVDSGTMVIPISRSGLAALNEKGELEFTLTRLFGDFTFKSAMLTAMSSKTSPVPIPGAVWLFGSALAGLLGCRRTFSRA